jgi:glycosyltransferase involved in cell wall biosynthesis
MALLTETTLNKSSKSQIMYSPKISVVTVCYNAVAIIEETMLSVINQTYRNIEYIIIDGGSTDGTIDVIRKYEDKIAYWISEPDKGIYDAMNKGIEAASGDYINFMNAGDKFATLYSVEKVAINIDKDTIICMCDWYNVTKKESVYKRPLKMKYLKETIVCCHQAILVSLSYHKKNLFDTSFRFCADYNLVYNAYYKDNVRVQYIPEILSKYILDEGFSANNMDQLEREKCRIWSGCNSINKIKIEMHIFIRHCWIALSRNLCFPIMEKINNARIASKSLEKI